MSRYFNNVLVLFLLVLCPHLVALASPIVELRTQARIAKGQPAIFKAIVIEPGIKQLRLRYKYALQDEYRYRDFKSRENEKELWVTISSDEILGPLIYFYVVWKDSQGQIQTVYGAPEKPHLISVDWQSGAVFHQYPSFNKDKALNHPAFKDRFGDDDASEQIPVLDAQDSPSFRKALRKWKPEPNKISPQELSRLGYFDLSSALSSFPLIYFRGQNFSSPSYNDFDATGRIKYSVNHLEVIDEYDASNDWQIAVLGASVNFLDTPDSIMGEAAGYFGSLNLATESRQKLLFNAGTGFSDQFYTALSSSFDPAGMDTNISGSLSSSGDGFHLASILQSQYFWGSEDVPLISGDFHFLATLPADEKVNRFVWNAALSFGLPISETFESQISLQAGQTFREHRLFRTAIKLKNRLSITPHHEMILDADFGFSGLVASETCSVFRMSLNNFGACRLKTSISFRDHIQFAEFVSLRSGLNISFADKEVVNLDTLLHPSFLIDLRPNDYLGLSAGFYKSLRWASFVETEKSSENELLPERSRIFVFGLELKAPSKYALFILNGQVRRGWLDDFILKDELNETYKNSQILDFFALDFKFHVYLADNNLVYVGGKFFSRSTANPTSRLLFGARLNLGMFGATHLEFQGLSASNGDEPDFRINAFYQSRPFIDSLIVEIRVLNLLSMQKNEVQELPDGLFAHLKFTI